jgi:hypothetical protein
MCSVGWHVDETLTAAEDDFAETLGVPEELVDVVVADDVSVVLFFADEFCIVALVAREAVERFDDGFETEAFLDTLGFCSRLHT